MKQKLADTFSHSVAPLAPKQNSGGRGKIHFNSTKVILNYLRNPEQVIKAPLLRNILGSECLKTVSPHTPTYVQQLKDHTSGLSLAKRNYCHLLVMRENTEPVRRKMLGCMRSYQMKFKNRIR